MKMHEKMAAEFVRLAIVDKSRDEIVAELLTKFLSVATVEDWERAFDLFEQHMTDFERAKKTALH
jgi:hypothetical protein